MEFMSYVFIKDLAWLMFQGKHSYGYPLLVIQNVQSFMFFFFKHFLFFFWFWMLVRENDSKAQHTPNLLATRIKMIISLKIKTRNSGMEKISEWFFSTAVFYKTPLWLGILEDQFHIDDKNNKHALSVIASFPSIQKHSLHNSTHLIFGRLFLFCWHMVIWMLM